MNQKTDNLFNSLVELEAIAKQCRTSYTKLKNVKIASKGKNEIVNTGEYTNLVLGLKLSFDRLKDFQLKFSNSVATYKFKKVVG